MDWIKKLNVAGKRGEEAGEMLRYLVIPESKPIPSDNDESLKQLEGDLLKRIFLLISIHTPYTAEEVEEVYNISGSMEKTIKVLHYCNCEAAHPIRAAKFFADEKGPVRVAK